MKKHNSEFIQIKKFEDNKMNTNNELYNSNNNYNHFGSYLKDNKIIDNSNENEDIKINNKKNKNIIYRQNFNDNINSFTYNSNDINKKNNFFGNNEKYEMIYSNMNKNIINSKEENNKISIEDNSNEKNYISGDDEFKNNNKENIYFNNNNFKNIELNSKKINKKFMTKILNLNNDSTHINQKNQFEEERNRLKQEIENLEKENDLLSNQLIDEEKKNEELLLIKKEKEGNYNSILSDISNCLQVNSYDDIIPKLTEMINYLTKYNNNKSSKKKEDIISKLKSLYIITNNSKEEKDNISIQDLWRWIKNLIEEVNELSLKKEKYEEMYNRDENDLYKNFCDKLINEFGLNSFDELKFFISDLMEKNDINKKRVEKLRKVLMNNNINEELSSGINKKYNYKEEDKFSNNSKINKDNINFKICKGINRDNSLNNKYNENYFYNYK